MRYDTPAAVASQLAKYFPNTNVRTVLDPSVGSGALLKPLLNRLGKHRAQVYCVDIDPVAIEQVRQSFSSALPKTIFSNMDFVEWSYSVNVHFDCIVMNPPFSGAKSKLKRFRFSDPIWKLEGIERFLPVEAVFLCRSVELLRNGGRILAILPASIIMSSTLQWLRRQLLEIGSIRIVHELPPRTFSGVESRMYLFVFEKGPTRDTIALLNHDLDQPEKLSVDVKAPTTLERFDFGFHRACVTLKSILARKEFGWRRLAEIAQVLRGDRRSPDGKSDAVHTWDFDGTFWLGSPRMSRLNTDSNSVLIMRGDLLVRRVGRGCSKSFGLAGALSGIRCTDCVLIVRPKGGCDPVKLLFGLRSLLEMPGFQSLIERGAGASYISQRTLSQLLVPTLLWQEFPRSFACFSLGLKDRSTKRISASINRSAGMLMRCNAY